MAKRRQFKLSLIIPIAVLAVAAGILFVTTRPDSFTRRVEDHNSPAARNTLREESIRAIASALKEYTATAPKTGLVLPASPTGICRGVTSSCRGTKLVDLNVLISRGYLDQIPSDPIGGYGRFVSGYEVMRSRETGEIVVSAPRAEGKVLSVSVQP